MQVDPSKVKPPPAVARRAEAVVWAVMVMACAAMGVLVAG